MSEHIVGFRIVLGIMLFLSVLADLWDLHSQKRHTQIFITQAICYPVNDHSVDAGENIAVQKQLHGVGFQQFRHLQLRFNLSGNGLKTDSVLNVVHDVLHEHNYIASLKGNQATPIFGQVLANFLLSIGHKQRHDQLLKRGFSIGIAKMQANEVPEAFLQPMFREVCKIFVILKAITSENNTNNLFEVQRLNAAEHAH